MNIIGISDIEFVKDTAIRPSVGDVENWKLDLQTRIREREGCSTYGDIFEKKIESPIPGVEVCEYIQIMIKI